MVGELKRIWYNPVTRRYVVSGFAGAQRTNLVCDAGTKVVYYQLSDGYMSPYISANGKYCQLFEHQIVEIDY